MANCTSPPSKLTLYKQVNPVKRPNINVLILNHWPLEDIHTKWLSRLPTPGTSQQTGRLLTPSSPPHRLHLPLLHQSRTPFLHRCNQSPPSSVPSQTSSRRTFHRRPRKEEFWTRQLQGTSSFSMQITNSLALISLPPRQSGATHPSPDSGLATSEGAPGDPSPPLLPPSPPPLSEGLPQVALACQSITSFFNQVLTFPKRPQPARSPYEWMKRQSPTSRPCKEGATHQFLVETRHNPCWTNVLSPVWHDPPTQTQGGRGRRTSTGWSTPTTRGWSWRRSSTTAGTSPSGEKLSSQMESASQRDR